MRGIEQMIEEELLHRHPRPDQLRLDGAREGRGLRVLDGHVNHCVTDALRSGDPQAAEAKTQELLHAVERFARAR
jgi:DNA-binding GntR family transcriptional regulator